jgi:hypothetical protein
MPTSLRALTRVSSLSVVDRTARKRGWQATCKLKQGDGGDVEGRCQSNRVCETCPDSARLTALRPRPTLILSGLSRSLQPAPIASRRAGWRSRPQPSEPMQGQRQKNVWRTGWLGALRTYPARSWLVRPHGGWWVRKSNSHATRARLPLHDGKPTLGSQPPWLRFSLSLVDKWILYSMLIPFTSGIFAAPTVPYHC